MERGERLMADDAPAIQQSLNATGLCILDHGRTYVLESQIVVPLNAAIVCHSWATFKCMYVGDAIVLKGNARLSRFRANGVNSSRIIVVAEGSDHCIDQVHSVGPMPCLEFLPSAGTRAKVNGGIYARTGGLPAIVMPEETATSTDRNLLHVQAGGGCLADLGTADNVLMAGCNFTNLVTRSGTRKLRMIGCRAANNDMTLQGVQHVLEGNIFAGNLILGADCRRSVIGPNTFADNKGVIDQSGGMNRIV